MKSLVRFLSRAYTVVSLFALGDVVGFSGLALLLEDALDGLLDLAGAAADLTPLESIGVPLLASQSPDELIATIQSDMPDRIKIHNIEVVGNEVVVKVAEGKGQYAQQFLPVAFDDANDASGPHIQL